MFCLSLFSISEGCFFWFPIFKNKLERSREKWFKLYSYTICHAIEVPSYTLKMFLATPPIVSYRPIWTNLKFGIFDKLVYVSN